MSENKFKVGDFVIKDVLEYVEGAVGISFKIVIKRGQVDRMFMGPDPFGEILVCKTDDGEEFSGEFKDFKYDIEKIRDSKIDGIAGIV